MLLSLLTVFSWLCQLSVAWTEDESLALESFFAGHVVHDAQYLLDEMERHQGFKMDHNTFADMEVEFLFFSQNDYDANQKLDGLEILAALLHKHDHEHHDVHDEDDGHVGDVPDPHDFVAEHDHLRHNYVEVIDAALASHDIDSDGYLSYPEFKFAARIHNIV